MKLKHLIIISLILLAITLLIQKCRACEFLICARTDTPNIYGISVICMPDNWIWGTEECLPKFYIIKCPQMSVAEGINYIGTEYAIDETAMSEPNKLTMKSTGRLSLTKAGILQCLKKKAQQVEP